MKNHFHYQYQRRKNAALEDDLPVTLGSGHHVTALTPSNSSSQYTIINISKKAVSEPLAVLLTSELLHQGPLLTQQPAHRGGAQQRSLGFHLRKPYINHNNTPSKCKCGNLK